MRSWKTALVGAAAVFIVTMQPVAADPIGGPESLVADVVAIANAERAERGLSELVEHPLLDLVAQIYARVLAEGACFGHECGEEPNLAERVDAVGYRWQRLGENIAAGQPTSAEVVHDWMDSPRHRANLLDPSFREIGVAVVPGAGPYGVYWVQLFGG
jgi:uncharacterized protein YkwD